MGQLAYKGFDKNLCYRGHQFEIGKSYEEEAAELCRCGFRACLRPLDVFNYYPPASSRYCLVEVDDICPKRDNDDTKICAKKITIVKELTIAELAKAHSKYAEALEHKKAGKYGAATAGDGGAATAGEYGAATAGDGGAATAGDGGAATAGDGGAATSRGKSATGKNGIAVTRGNGVMAKGGIGTVIVIVNEMDDSYDIAEWKAGVIDGEKLKADTWYKLENGEFVEAQNENEND